MYETVLAEIHDRWFDQIAKAASRHLKSLAPPGGIGSLLDLGCGGGILLRELSETCIDQYGVDISSEMISIARTRLPHANLQCASILDHTFPKVDMTVMAGEILSYAAAGVHGSDDAVTALLRRIFLALKPQGLLLFDVLGSEHNYEGSFFHDSEDWTVHSEVTQKGKIVTRHIITFLRSGPHFKKSVETHHLRTFSEEEISKPLKDLGFKIQRIPKYDDMEILPGRMAFECRKIG